MLNKIVDYIAKACVYLYIRLFVTKTDYNTIKIQLNRQTDRQTNKHYN